MPLPDVTSFLQSISTASWIIGTLGLTTLAISLVERHAIAKEHKRERFERLVLTSAFFVHMSAFWKLDDICRAALAIKEKGSTVILIDDKIVPIKDMASLEAEFEKLCVRVVVAVEKVQEGGAFFFVPTQIRQSIGQLGDFFEKIELDKMDSHILAAYRTKLGELGKLLRKEVGLK